jgi:hypothetical protein
MIRRLLSVTAPIVWLVATAVLAAPADPLEVIPDDTLGLVVIKNMAEANRRVQGLTEKMKIPAPDLLSLVKSMTGIDKGVDEDGGIAAAVFPDDEAGDVGISMLVFVPVTDYKAFIEQLQPGEVKDSITEITVFGQACIAAKRGDFAVVSDPKKRAILEKALASSKNVTATLEPLRNWMAGKDAALVVTPAGKKMLFEKLISLIPDSPKDDDKKDDAKDDAEDEADPIKTLLKIAQAAKRVLEAAEPELTHLALGVRIDDDSSLHVAARLRFTPGGKLAGWAKDIKLPEHSLLAGLPSGKFAIAAGGVGMQLSPDVAKIVNQFSQIGLQQFAESSGDDKKFDEAMNRQRATGGTTATMMGLLRPGDSIFSSAVSVERVKSSTAHLKASRELLQVMSEGIKNKSTGEPIYTVDDVKVGDLKAIELTTDLTGIVGAAGDNPAAEQMQSIFGRMFGNGGKPRAYMAAADDHNVVTAYTKEQLERIVAHVRSAAKGLETDPQIAKTNALLPTGAQWVAYVSPQGLLQWVDVLVRQGLQGQGFQIPAFPESDPIGLAARVSDSGLDAELVLPESVVAGLGQFIGTVQQLFQGGGVPLP